MYELEYWCPNQSRWLRIEGPDYDDINMAAAMAQQYAANTGRVIRVVDPGGWSVYQAG